MKKQVLQEMTCCDRCDGEWAWHKCQACHKDLCNKCAVVYSLYEHGVSSTPMPHDGFYCKQCDVEMNDPLHQAWVALKEFHQRKAAAMAIWYAEADEKQKLVETLRRDKYG